MYLFTGRSSTGELSQFRGLLRGCKWVQLKHIIYTKYLHFLSICFCHWVDALQGIETLINMHRLTSQALSSACINHLQHQNRCKPFPPCSEMTAACSPLLWHRPANRLSEYIILPVQALQWTDRCPSPAHQQDNDPSTSALQYDDRCPSLLL